jgi:signal transduction histidine kinase
MVLDINLEGKKIKLNLKKELIISYLIIVLICISITGVLLDRFIKSEFQKYIITIQKKESEEIVSRIKNQFNKENQWNYVELENIGIEALEKGFIVRINDYKQNILWDANIHSSNECEYMMSSISENMEKFCNTSNAGYVENEYVIKDQENLIGTVIIGYYGPFYYNDNDIMFLNTLNKVLIVVGIISALLALIVGVFIAEKLSKPIAKVIESTKDIAKGKYSTRIHHKTSTKEVNNLIDSVNNMASCLEENQYLQKRLTEDISHELRTPLTTLQGNLEAMIDGLLEPTNERLEICYEEILRLTRMTKDLEKLSYYEKENLVLQKSKFDIYDVLKSLVKNFENQVTNKKIVVELLGKPLEIYADKDKLFQAIINIIANSIKYTKDNGEIIIKLTQAKETVFISIKDSGIGIKKEHINKVFNRLYRVDESRNKETGGRGLGLTITKAIVEAHNGKITIESKENKGTEIIIEIPQNI